MHRSERTDADSFLEASRNWFVASPGAGTGLLTWIAARKANNEEAESDARQILGQLQRAPLLLTFRGDEEFSPSTVASDAPASSTEKQGSAALDSQPEHSPQSQPDSQAQLRLHGHRWNALHPPTNSWVQ